MVAAQRGPIPCSAYLFGGVYRLGLFPYFLALGVLGEVSAPETYAFTVRQALQQCFM